jgi:hypothetical protein
MVNETMAKAVHLATAESLNDFFIAFTLSKFYDFQNPKLKCKKNVFPVVETIFFFYRYTA